MRAVAKFLKDLFVAFCLACEIDASGKYEFRGNACAMMAAA